MEKVALVIRLRDSKKTFKAGIMSGLRRLFQSVRERNRTWIEMYLQIYIAGIAVRERATNSTSGKKKFPHLVY